MSETKKKKNILMRLLLFFLKSFVLIAFLGLVFFGYQKGSDYLDWRKERDIVRSHLQNTLPGYEIPLADEAGKGSTGIKADKSLAYALPYRQTFNGITFEEIKGDFVQTSASPDLAAAFSPYVLLTPPISLQGAKGEVLLNMGSFSSLDEIKPAAYGLENGSVKKLSKQSYDKAKASLTFQLESSKHPLIAIIDESVPVQEYRLLKIIDPDDGSLLVELMFILDKEGNSLLNLPELTSKLTNAFKTAAKEEVLVSPMQALLLDQTFNSVLEKSIDVFTLPFVRSFGEKLMEALGEDLESFDNEYGDKDALLAIFREQVSYKKGLRRGDILSTDVFRDDEDKQDDANAGLDILGDKGYKAGAVWDSGFSVYKDGFSFKNLGPAQSPGGICMGFAVISEGVYNKFVGQDILPKQSIPGYQYQPGGYQYNYDLTSNLYNPLFRKGSVISYDLSDTIALLMTDYDGDNDPSPPPLAENTGSKDGPLLTALAGHWDKGNMEFLSRIGYRAPQDFDNIERLKELFEKGQVVTVGLAGDRGGHAIVAYRLDQSAEDPDRYWLYVYDNNNPCNRLYSKGAPYDGSNLLKIEIRKVIDHQASQDAGETRYSYEYDYLIYTEYGMAKNNPYSSSKYGGSMNFMYRFNSLAAAIPNPNPGPGKKAAAPPGPAPMPAPVTTPEVEAKEAEAGVLSVASYVQLGRYQGQPLLWQVINLEDGKATLFADQVLQSKSFDAAGDSLGGVRDPKGHALKNGSNYWGQASIREWLNSKDSKVKYTSTPPVYPKVAGESYDQEAGFLTNFTDKEIQAMLPLSRRTLLNWWDKGFHEGGTPSKDVMVAASKGEILNYKENIARAADNYDKALYQKFTDTVFLLSVQELHDYVYANGLSIQAAWQAGKSQGQAASYWLRTPLQGASSTMRYVNVDNLVLNEVAYASMGIRPALVISTEGLSGKGTKADPFRLK